MRPAVQSPASPTGYGSRPALVKWCVVGLNHHILSVTRPWLVRPPISRMRLSIARTEA